MPHGPPRLDHSSLEKSLNALAEVLRVLCQRHDTALPPDRVTFEIQQIGISTDPSIRIVKLRQVSEIRRIEK